jgi:predicted aspartyl protease
VKSVLPGLIFLSVVLFEHAPAAEKDAAAEPGSLKAFFIAEKFAGAPLQRRLGNHLFVSTLINKRRTALMIDTGAPFTLIDRNSVRSLGLNVQATKAVVGGVFGWKHEHFGVAKLDTLAMGNCTLTNVPVAIADESEINYYARVSHLDGLFGAHEMAKFGMVIDCARQMLYVNPRGPSDAASAKLHAFLADRGFTAIPMHLDAHHHFYAEASINGHPSRLLIDSGASTTLLAKQTATAAAVSPIPLRAMAGSEGRFVRISGGRIHQLEIGSFKIPNAEVTIAETAPEVGAGLLGEEYLSWNFAVIDVGGGTLYLRHPDSR